MSAYFAQKKHDRVVILSDAAVYDNSLIIRQIRSKIDRIGKFNALAVSRGQLDITAAATISVRKAFDASDTFDMAIDVIRSGFAMIDPSRKQRPFEIIIAGVSESKGPSLYAFTNQKVEGIEPFILHEIDGAVSNGFVLSADHLEGIEKNGGVDGFGVHIFELMRAVESQPIVEGSVPGYIVGGFIERADITVDNVTTDIIHHWPDEVGRRIEPDMTAAQRAA